MLHCSDNLGVSFAVLQRLALLSLNSCYDCCLSLTAECCLRDLADAGVLQAAGGVSGGPGAVAAVLGDAGVLQAAGGVSGEPGAVAEVLGGPPAARPGGGGTRPQAVPRLLVVGVDLVAAHGRYQGGEKPKCLPHFPPCGQLSLEVESAEVSLAVYFCCSGGRRSLSLPLLSICCCC